MAASARKGPPGPPGQPSINALVGNDGSVTISILTNWGIDQNGGAYYEPAGVTNDDAAWASFDSDGHLTLTKPS